MQLTLIIAFSNGVKKVLAENPDVIDPKNMEQLDVTLLKNLLKEEWKFVAQ